MGRNVEPLWVGLLLTVLAAVAEVIFRELFRLYRSRTRPQYLICEEEERTPFLINDRHTTLQDILKPAYQGKRLWITKLKFYNYGSESIETARTTVEFNKGVSILGPPAVEPEHRKAAVSVLPDGLNDDAGAGKNKMVLEIDDLKPVRTYKEASIRLSFITTGRVTDVQVSGHGPAWELKHVPLGEAQKVARSVTHVHILEFVAGMLMLVGFAAIPQRALMPILPGVLGAAGLIIIYFALRSVFILRQYPPLAAEPRYLYVIIVIATVAAIAMWAYAWKLA